MRKNSMAECHENFVFTCNPSYSGGRDQEDHDSKAAQTNSSRDPISKKTQHKKRAGGLAQGEGPEFKSQLKKKKKDLVFQKQAGSRTGL
jgi:hypothetical protein